MPHPNNCEHSKYKLCFKLKQHTPIIHFQADQKGATLRATELKPKLDRFLMEYFQKENKRLKEINCYRGTRHAKNLPVRGQRTRTNSRTVRGNVRKTAGSGRRPAPEKT